MNSLPSQLRRLPPHASKRSQQMSPYPFSAARKMAVSPHLTILMCRFILRVKYFSNVEIATLKNIRIPVHNLAALRGRFFAQYHVPGVVKTKTTTPPPPARPVPWWAGCERLWSATSAGCSFRVRETSNSTGNCNLA